MLGLRLSNQYSCKLFFPQSQHSAFSNSSLIHCAHLLIAVILTTLMSSTQVYAEQLTLKTDTKVVNLGKRVFQQACFYCHQTGGIGKPGLAPSLVNKEFLSITSDELLTKIIRNGRGGTGMPPFNYLGDQKISAIVAYLRSHATAPSRANKVAAEPKSKGDPASGKTVFKQICFGCHGPGGNGYEAGGTGTAIGKQDFLDQVSDGYIRTTIKEGRSNTRMREFQGPAAMAALTNKEIEDIIAYLRTAPGMRPQ